MWRGDEGQQTFFGSGIYAQVVPRDHFLVRLNQIVDWQAVAEPFKAVYKGGGEYGRPAWKPAVMLRMLFLSYAYNLSEVQTEQFVTYYLPAKEFVGLEVHEAAPDHSTLSVFRSRVLAKAQDVPFQQAFDEVLRQAAAHGVVFGKVQILDSVHTVANVDIPKDERRQQTAQKPPRDPDARWGCKGDRVMKRPDGTSVKRPLYFYGYKTHVSLNQQTRLVTSLYASPGNAPDTRYFRPLLELDRWKGLRPKVAAADAAYDDGENHMYCQAPERAIVPAIRLRKSRLASRGQARRHWEAVVQHPWYRKALGLRYKIEQLFGIAKRWYGFARCRSQGLGQYAIQAYLTFMTYNLKRLLTLVPT